MLHPCQTGEVMRLLLGTAVADGEDGGGSLLATTDGTEGGGGGVGQAWEAAQGSALCALRYLLAWLSVAGQPLGLALPAELWAQVTAAG